MVATKRKPQAACKKAKWTAFNTLLDWLCDFFVVVVMCVGERFDFFKRAYILLSKAKQVEKRLLIVVRFLWNLCKL